ncbi:MAG: hypothetical protein EPN91_00090 [Salinibacterium sp.]|nr:MAG: hypothetical protein EPN91_00090 [Salinibacterium sp.]
MPTVKATREGLLGSMMASHVRVDLQLPFVALPSVRALYRFVRVTNALTKESTMAIVLDVGPWNTHDDIYVFGDARPQAETGIDTRGRATNHAGIDLSETVWAALGMVDNTTVTWEFLN